MNRRELFARWTALTWGIATGAATVAAAVFWSAGWLIPGGIATFGLIALALWPDDLCGDVQADLGDDPQSHVRVVRRDLPGGLWDDGEGAA